MTIIRTVFGIAIIAGLIKLFFWVLPTLGIFRFEPTDLSLPVNGASLVIFKNGKSIDAISLRSLKTGWSVIGEGWPLMVIGVMVGYPLGELARRKFAIDKASEEAISQCMSLKLDTFSKEVQAQSILQKAMAIHTETPQLKKEVNLARGKIFAMSLSAKEQQTEYEVLRQKAESLERELAKAKAKIRRLDRKFDSQKGKSIDADQ